MTSSEKKDFNEKSENNELTNLLDNLIEDIKNNENVDNNNAFEKLASLKKEVEKSNSDENLQNIFSEINEELASLKQSTEYNEQIKEIEQKIEEYEKKIRAKTKSELSSLQQNIYKKQNLSPKQIVEKANKWREKSYKKMDWIVWKIAQWDWFFAKVAKKLG